MVIAANILSNFIETTESLLIKSEFSSLISFQLRLIKEFVNKFYLVPPSLKLAPSVLMSTISFI